MKYPSSTASGRSGNTESIRRNFFSYSDIAAAHCRINRLIQQTIGIYSASDLVSKLRHKCPDLTFADSGIEREVSRIAVIDSDSHASVNPPPRKSIVRIVLGMDEPAQRRQGEIFIDRKSFL